MDAQADGPGFQFVEVDLGESEPASVRSVENEDVSMLFLPFEADDHQPLERVPDLSAGTAGCATPAAGSAPAPATPYRGGSIHPAEAPPIENATSPPPTAPPAPVRQRCGTRARSSRGRAVRVRGSRRSTAAAHSSSSDDPGPGEPPGHRRVAA